jgi:hypothetical protein
MDVKNILELFIALIGSVSGVIALFRALSKRGVENITKKYDFFKSIIEQKKMK